MQLLKISYSRLQHYAIPYITEFFYAGSAIIVAILITVNSECTAQLVKSPLKEQNQSLLWEMTLSPSSRTVQNFPSLSGGPPSGYLTA
jgi:hypothetical protein